MTELKDRIRIGVIGGSNPESQALKIAYSVGQLIGKRGGILVCGGLSGVMEAAARGAKKAEGITIGILPGNSFKGANKYIDIPVATGMGYTRNSLVALNSDVIIAINGQFGTLSEIAYGAIYGKPIIGLQTWDIPGIKKVKTPEEAVGLAWKYFFPLEPNKIK